MKIDVIVPAYKAEMTVDPCLDALFAAGFTPDSIIVVDDGSPDNTVAIVRSRGIEPIRQDNKGSAQARNVGAAASSADILLFVDSDVVVHHDVRTRVLRFFASYPDHAGVFGSYDDAPPAPPRVSRLRNLLHHHVHQKSAGPASTFWTGCGALRRVDFEAVGGFLTQDERIEDVILGLRLARLGRPVLLDPDLLCTHLKSWSWWGFAFTDYRHRAQPWTRVMHDPANKDLAHVLNAGRHGKAAVVSVGVSLFSLPLILVSPILGVILGMLSLVSLIGVERQFLSLVWRQGRKSDAIVAVAMLWVHYLAAGIGYAQVRLTG